MAPFDFPIRTTRPAHTGLLRLRPVVRRAGDSDLTPFGPAFECECAFATFRDIFITPRQDFQREYVLPGRGIHVQWPVSSS